MLRKAILSLLLSLYVLTAGATQYVNDGGTWRQLINVYVNDGGTWRDIQEIYVNDGGTWRSVFARVANFTLTGGGGNDGFLFSWVGYIRGSIGTLTPGGTGNLPGSRTFESVLDYRDFGGGTYNHSSFCVTGFGSDPGQTGYFVSITVNGINKTAAGANWSFGAYSYNAGTGEACWNWEGGSVGFNLTGAPGNTIAVNF
jgi:hypothetical protein